MLEFLHQAARTLKPLFDSISEGVIVVDPHGKQVLWNSAAERILGVHTSRQEGVWTDRGGVFAADGITPLAPVERPLPRAIRGETVTDQEFVIRRDDGVRVRVSATAGPLHDLAHRIVGGVAIFRDVGEQRRAQAALKESETLYRTLARHLPSAIVLMYDRSLRMTLAEGGGLRAAGFTPQQIEGRPVIEFATGLSDESYSAVFDGVVSDAMAERNGRSYRVQLVPVRDDQQQVYAGLVLAEDITERERQEQGRSQTEHFKFLAEAIPQIVWTAAPDGELDYYNQTWFDYTGMTLEQTKGWGWGPVLHPDDLQNCVDVWTEAVRTGHDYEVNYRFKRAADGHYRWHLGRARAARNAEGQIVKWFGTCTDIDDQRRAEDALRETAEQLEARVRDRTAQLTMLNAALGESLREKDVLLKEVHHRVKNNLQVVSSLLKLHAEQVTDTAALAAFQDSQERVRAIALLHEQLYQSKNLGAVRVASYADTLAQTLARGTAQRAVRFEIDCGQISLPVDTAMPFGLILNELLTNSLKHGFSASKVDDPIIRIELRVVGDTLELLVADNGCGFSSDFDPAKPATSLGMHLILALSGQLGGRIEFASAGGAVCRLTFPIPFNMGMGTQ